MLEQEILGWSALKDGASIGPILQRLQNRQNREDLTESEVRRALDTLLAKELLEKSGNEWRLIEPDRDEVSLYPSLMIELQRSSFLAKLGIHTGSYVIEDTSMIAGNEGRYSRPDLVIASIHRWKYDPQRSLEVYSFEVKNRKGSNVPAVYEALAHTRFVNHAFLVIPRTHLDLDNHELIKTTCQREGVGLILFDLLAATIDPGFRLENLSIELDAIRRPTDPKIVEDFLDARLNQAGKDKLSDIASGAAP